MTKRPKPEPEPRYGEYGHLTYDEIEDGLLCHECGGWYGNLATHARLAHQISAEGYREKHGLNRSTKLLTPTIRERLRQASLPGVPEKLARGHLLPFDKYPEQFREARELAAETMHEGLRPEGIRHRKDSWDEGRRGQMRALRRERTLAGLGKPTSWQIREAIRRTGGEARCERCGLLYRRENERERYCPTCKLEARKEAGRARERKDKAEPNRPRRVQIHESDARDVKCPRCGRQFQAPSHRDVYCPECRPEMMREYQREHKRRQKAKRDRERQGLLEPSREIACVRCGHAFVALANNSKFCQTCQREENRERLREYHQRRKAKAAGGAGALVEGQADTDSPATVPSPESSLEAEQEC